MTLEQTETIMRPSATFLTAALFLMAALPSPKAFCDRSVAGQSLTGRRGRDQGRAPAHTTLLGLEANSGAGELIQVICTDTNGATGTTNAPRQGPTATGSEAVSGASTEMFRNTPAADVIAAKGLRAVEPGHRLDIANGGEAIMANATRLLPRRLVVAMAKTVVGGATFFARQEACPTPSSADAAVLADAAAIAPVSWLAIEAAMDRGQSENGRSRP